MAIFIRILLSVVSVVFIGGAAALLTLFAHHPRDTASIVMVAALTALAVPPIMAGSFSSYWSWTEADSRRRLRRMLAILLAVQVAGAVVVVVTGLLQQVVLAVLVAVVVVALLLTPALIALGRLALRFDRLPEPSSDDWVDTTRSDLRRGYRGAFIGFGIGIVLSVALVVALSLTAEAHGRGDRLAALDPELLLLGLGIPFLAAAIGMSRTTYRTSRRIRGLVGREYGAMRRIARVVLRRKSDLLTGAEQRSAVRYATVVGQWLPFQTVQFGLIYTGLALNQVGLLLSPHRLEANGTWLLVLIAALVLYVIPLQVIRARNARRYAAEHGELATAAA